MVGKVIINLKQRPIKRKTILGPIFKINEKIHLMMSIVVPSPQNWRVEPHIVYDPKSEIKYNENGSILELSGNVILAKHEGIEELLYKGLEKKIYPSYHLAPWGLPVITPPLEFRTPDKQLEVALYSLDVWKVSEWTLSYFLKNVTIEFTS